MSEKTSRQSRCYTVGEEIVNAITHGIGGGLAIAALVLLVVRAACHAPVDRYASCVVGYALFGSTLVLLYLMSTLYHALSFTRAGLVFRILDHTAIYLLIAGTYSAFSLTMLPGALGWTIFGISWGLALVGITLDAATLCRHERISLAIYLLMGWLILIAIRPLLAAATGTVLIFLASGGLCYTLGCVFFVIDRLYMHGVWHLFVVAGSILQFFAAYFLLPMS